MLKNLKNSKGFTLVELIIVIAILAIIMLIAIPNFSGIQQRMQVRADKATAAQIGKAVRIWYSEYQTDPAFKATVDAGKKLPTASDATKTMIELKELTNINDYVDNTLIPSSLRKANGTKDTDQKYWLGIAGSGSYEKVVVCIAKAAPTLPAPDTDTGAAGVTNNDAGYDGEEITETDAAVIFKATLAYVES